MMTHQERADRRKAATERREKAAAERIRVALAALPLPGPDATLEEIQRFHALAEQTRNDAARGR